MIRIDLAKDELQKKTPKKSSFLNLSLDLKNLGKKSKIKGDVEKYSILGGATALAILPWLFVSQFENFMVAQHQKKMMEFQRKLELVGTEIAKLKPFQEELQSFEKQRKLVTDRLTVVRELLESRNAPVSILDGIGQSMPPRTWVNSVDLNLNADKPALGVQGQSYSNEEISDYVDKLTESVYLTDVLLGDVIGSKADGQVSVREFAIVAKPKVNKISQATPATPPAPAAKK